MQFEEYALTLNAGDFASRSKAKTKPQRRDSASSSTRTTPTGERSWTDVEPGKYSLSDYSVSKNLIHLLRHGSLPRDNDGAIELWRIQDDLRNKFEHSSMEEDSPQGIWDKKAEKMLLEFAEIGCPIFRATTPLSKGQLRSKGHGKLSIHFAATQATIETVFSHNCFCTSAQSLRSSRGNV